MRARSELTATEKWLIDWLNTNAACTSVHDPDKTPVLVSFMVKDLAKALDERPPEAHGKTYKFSPGAHWLDQPIEEMSAPFLRAALLYKIIELRECYDNMTMDQKRFVAGQMEKVEIPFDVIG